MTGTIRRQALDGGVLLFVIDNPPVNTMTGAMLRQLCDDLVTVDGDGTTRAVIITGHGGAFCGGADIRRAAREGIKELEPFGVLFEILSGMAAPVIAAIDGPCVGGGLELALCCDLRIASTRANFICAGVNMGLIASAYRLPRLIGPSRAKAMLLTGSLHDAETALDWGLVTALHAPDALSAAAIALASRIASRAPLSVEAIKRVVDRAIDMAPEAAAAVQQSEARRLMATADHREAVAAFLAKRQPRFSGA